MKKQYFDFKEFQLTDGGANSDLLFDDFNDSDASDGLTANPKTNEPDDTPATISRSETVSISV